MESSCFLKHSFSSQTVRNDKLSNICIDHFYFCKRFAFNNEYSGKKNCCVKQAWCLQYGCDLEILDVWTNAFGLVHIRLTSLPEYHLSKSRLLFNTSEQLAKIYVSIFVGKIDKSCDDSSINGVNMYFGESLESNKYIGNQALFRFFL